MIKNIKLHNILNIIKISKSMESNKCIQIYFLWKYSFKCFLRVFKVWWVQENQIVMFLVVLWIVSPFNNVESKENAGHGISLFLLMTYHQ
jgi:hypothetical protein